MKLNPEMVILAREFRGKSQAELAAASGITQARVARIEAGVGAELDDKEVSRLAGSLRFPRDFFFMNESRYSYGTSAMFTRTRQMTAAEKKRLSGAINIQRIHIKKMLDHVDLQASRPLPKFGLDDFMTPEAVAGALREAWRLPSGPIQNLTKLIEGAGVLVVDCDFLDAPMDATSVSLANLPPMVFINKNVPGDRYRFTLAHELAHLVMHDVPHPAMEDEADAFASEFLVPSEEIAPSFSAANMSRLSSYITFKGYWQVSIASLVMKAARLGKITDEQKKGLFVQMAKLGIRKNEPAPIQREAPSLYPSLVSYFRDESGFTADEFAKAIVYLPEALHELYEWDAPSSKPKLRVVR